MANFIKVNEQYAIASDSNQWMIQSPRNKKDKDTGQIMVEWVSNKYFGNLESAIKFLWGQMLREGSCNSMADLVALSHEITDVLNGVFTVQLKKLN